MKQRKLVVISSGLSQPSSTRLLADQLSAAAVGAAAQLGVTLDTQVIELRDLAHEITDNMLTGFAPTNLKQAQEAVTAADALIVVTPVFSASYSGLFKSFVDVLDKDALVDKPVLLAATAGTARHSLVIEHALRPLFAYLRASILPTGVFAASDDWGANSVEGPLRGRIDRAAAELAREVERREPAVVTDPFALTSNFEDLLKNL
ncbi:putative NADPH-dependent FMN reductase [Actinoplanes missouriensis 431]|uniref:Putative NADPH-dependent FMN reductase n=1 Tax=Actinoplanes missouriensis (strain ATCC 14538 / DSM 43046 / CBS 188.64 / JCM 3121 / NBRC 102363 / NCIMB 12654 / NRRL B-3342 / UNCC 431) TaxID=512565 RepID=I0HAT7_ACTM4|nr:FMN reductase [Actinoplanes missouriensis]BAL90124.1 putative NADPH-dependent FMN reductase [Actinoplanes missouriensis 431]